MIVETNAVPCLGGGLVRRWLADVMEKDTPRQRWGRVFGEPLEHQARVNPYISFGMKLGRLFNAFHRPDFGKDLLEEPGLIQQFERLPGRALGKHFCEFFAEALRRNLVDLGDVAANRPKRCGFDFESKARGESHRAHHA